MENLLVVFITGLTTGGLSCLAVQGGLLAGSLANQAEEEIRQSLSKENRQSRNKAGSGRQMVPAKGAEAGSRSIRSSHYASLILLFLTTKILAYTLLGFLLGSLGSVFELSPISRAILQLAIGIFLIGNALRMLNVHPIFRYFSFEPPAFLRRFIRRTASRNTSWFVPAFLGALTVFIPCGVTQAMMAAAIGTGSPWQGAALMFAFTLGTSPLFFIVAYFTTQLGAKLEKNFLRFTAIVVLVIGLITIDTGLNLAGSPVSVSRLFNRQSINPAQTIVQTDNRPTIGPQSEQDAGENEIIIKVGNHGYEPDLIHAKAGVPLKLKLVSKGTYSCSLAFVIPSLNYQVTLEPTDSRVVDIPAQEAGTVMRFSCSMGMYTGQIMFDL